MFGSDEVGIHEYGFGRLCLDGGQHRGELRVAVGVGDVMTPDAIFRIASMTKPMVTVAALSLYEEGRLFLSDPVSKYIPAFKGQRVGVERAAPEREMTIQDLMRHTSGLTYGNRGTTEVHKMYPESSNAASLTLTMPFACFAFTSAASTPSGNSNLRWNAPYATSRRK